MTEPAQFTDIEVSKLKNAGLKIWTESYNSLGQRL